MTKVFRVAGSKLIPSDPSTTQVLASIPVGTYCACFHPDIGFYLEPMENLGTSGKLYGDTETMTSRIITTFADRPAGTGVMLAGTKGSGKSLQARHVSQTLRGMDVPTIVVSTPFNGPNFNDFIQGIAQPALVLFDEFEKVYNDREHQANLLTLLDGTCPSKKLFMFTCNHIRAVDDHLQNRPGRIFYFKEYGSISKEFVEEYCKDHLKNLANIGGVFTVHATFSQFSFDMLKALIEDMNRYNETASSAMSILNIRPASDENGSFVMHLERDGEKIDGGFRSKWRGNPLVMHFGEHFNTGIERDDDFVNDFAASVKSLTAVDGASGVEKSKPQAFEDLADSDGDIYICVSADDLIGYDFRTGVFSYKTRFEGITLVLTREVVNAPKFYYDV